MTAASPFTAPVVDALSVRVLVDSRYERFLPRMSHPQVKIEHIGRILGRPESTLACEWGLSLHLSSEKDGAKAQYVLDFGYTPEIINRNFELLGIEPARINGLILSHGHLDHFGGLQGFVRQHRAQMRDDLALYVGGDTIFRTKWVKEGGETLPWCTLDRAALEAQRVLPVCCPQPQALDGPFTSGYIERNSFETVTGGSLVMDDHFTGAERAGKLVKDTHPDEHATCYIVKGKGLVVISSCGHTGIINTVRSAMKAANTGKVHAVMGGFHLGPSPLDYLQHTLQELKAINPDVIVPMHCTGERFIDLLRQQMPERVVYSNVGSRYTFGMQ
jgi:7,8-dihydropterin-6-yl-methyl-4-(beta-D-ribofuranosyl)aminobenzene 5'-phosphate synthase